MNGVPSYFNCSYASSYSIVTDVSEIMTMFGAMVVALPEPWSSLGSGQYVNTDSGGNTFAVTLSRSDAQNLHCAFRDGYGNLLGTRAVRIRDSAPYSECYMYVGKYYFHIDLQEVSGTTPTLEYLRGGVVDTYPNSPALVGTRSYFYGVRDTAGALDAAPYCDDIYVTGGTSSTGVGGKFDEGHQYCRLLTLEHKPMAFPLSLFCLPGGGGYYKYCGLMYQHYAIDSDFLLTSDNVLLREFIFPIGNGVLGKFRVIMNKSDSLGNLKHVIRIG